MISTTTIPNRLCRICGVIAMLFVACTTHASKDSETITVAVDTTKSGQVIALSDGSVVSTTTGTVNNPTLIEVPDSTARIVVWDQTDESGNTWHNYSIAVDGTNFSDPGWTDRSIHLRYAQFDPLIAQPIIPKTLVALNPIDETDEQVFVVQFHGPPVPALVEPLRVNGAHPLKYLPDHAFAVRMTANVRDQVSAMPHVRWVGAYHTVYKLEELLIGELSAPIAIAPTRRYSIMMFERGPAPQEVVSNRIEALGGTIELKVHQSFRIEATLTLEQLRKVVAMDEVMFVDRWSPPEPDMDNARYVGGALPTLWYAGILGEGVRGEVLDGGCRLTHVDFHDPLPLIHGTAGVDPTHGTQTYGIVFGSGSFDFKGTGMLPNREQGIFSSYQTLGNRFTHTEELVDPDGEYRTVFQSNSWGSALSTSYTTISAEMDDIIFNTDLLICQSQSNAGSRSSRPQAWAKNIVAVGGIFHANNQDHNDDLYTSASVGPASDGRTKPDLTHFYDNVYCPTYLSDVSYTGGFNGTSAATPIVAGHFGLLFQMWHEEFFPCFGGQSTVFESRAHSSTVKALMINSAYRYDWQFGGANGTLTRFRQGWGMPDLKRLYDERNDLFIVNETDLLTPSTKNEYRILVDEDQFLLRVTMVYTDPIGNPGASVHRINDLHLKVTDPNGVFYWGAHGLTDSNYSASGFVASKIETVENVFVQDPEPGVWLIEVFGEVIVEDSHLETPEIDADYALVVNSGLHTVLGDLNNTGTVNVDDVLLLIAAWGFCPAVTDECNPCLGDLNLDGTVNVDDLLIQIGNWG